METKTKKTNGTLDEAIYQKYIQPTQRVRKPCVGSEFELPIVNLSGQAVDFDAVHKLNL